MEHERLHREGGIWTGASGMSRSLPRRWKGRIFQAEETAQTKACGVTEHDMVGQMVWWGCSQGAPWGQWYNWRYHHSCSSLPPGSPFYTVVHLLEWKFDQVTAITLSLQWFSIVLVMKSQIPTLVYKALLQLGPKQLPVFYLSSLSTHIPGRQFLGAL